MQVSVRKPQYDDEFSRLISRAHKKGCSISIHVEGENLDLQATVKASGRVVGRFTFVLDEDNYILEKRHIIEKEFQPLEFAVSELATFCKRRKILAICSA